MAIRFQKANEVDSDDWYEVNSTTLRPSFHNNTGVFIQSIPRPRVVQTPQKVDVDLDSMVDKLWEKMMNKKPIVFCAHCEAAMVFDSPTCPQCGAPGGRAIR